MFHDFTLGYYTVMKHGIVKLNLNYNAIVLDFSVYTLLSDLHNLLGKVYHMLFDITSIFLHKKYKNLSFFFIKFLCVRILQIFLLFYSCM